MATGKRLTGPEKVRQLQTVLHAKAKEEPGRRFILGWKVLGHARRFRAEIVNYADDICVLGTAHSRTTMDSLLFPSL